LNWERMGSELRSAFVKVRQQTGAGKSSCPPPPVDMHSLLLKAAETDEEREEIEDEVDNSNPASALTILETHWDWQTLIKGDVSPPSQRDS